MTVPTCQLTQLPQEILVQIFDELEPQKTDIESLGFTCKRLFQISQQFRMSDVTVTWQVIDVFHTKLETTLEPLIPYIKSLSIKFPSSWGEWHRSDTLQDVLEKCYNIESLELTLSGSSNWLQYLRPNTHVRKLRLLSSQANFRPALFDIADLHAFKTVEVLHLDFFRLQGGSPIEERLMPLLNTVKELEIVNCEWKFPFSMNLFRKLESLTVYYTIKCEAFTFSERLKSLASNPPVTLKQFIMHLNLFSPVRQKTWYPILNGCTELKFISLKGFRYPPFEFFALLPESLKQIELHMTSRNYFSQTQAPAAHMNRYGNAEIRIIDWIKQV
ncbi:hypothetical protein V1512DRAFT_258372 [Lipomyces arxii]|uniref:uncharacterized protein n=1 Tax=Lipomyces arxii TaxID=56418 RepID=UPI0034CDE5FC